MSKGSRVYADVASWIGKETKPVSIVGTPANRPIPRSYQVPNDGGGYGWQVDKWKQLDRFLILGTEGGTYYVGEQKLTMDNAKSVAQCVKEDGMRTVKRIVEISTSGRANKNNPALFALALCMSNIADEATRREAYSVIPRVARIGTHLFDLMTYVLQFRGSSKGLRRGVAAWYNGRKAEHLAVQLVKYRQRNGWTHRDVLRRVHPKPATPAHQSLFNWAIYGSYVPSIEIVEAYEEAKEASESRLIELVLQKGLMREGIPTDKLTAGVWSALLVHMKYEAMIRNLATMTVKGVLTKDSTETKLVVARLQDAAGLKESMLHPMKILSAFATYSSGQGLRGNQAWTPVREIVDALSDAFYASFGNVTPTNKRLLFGIDISGSMFETHYGSFCSGIPNMLAGDAAAALALITANVESDYEIYGFSHKFVKLNINPNMRLDAVKTEMRRHGFGSTNCSLPMTFAIQNRLPVDAFLVYTDNETNTGSIHPSEALKRHRDVMGMDSKLAVTAMTASKFSIADPRDSGMMDFVGFDADMPEAMSQFILS